MKMNKMSTYMQEIDMFKTFECFGEHQIQNFNNSKYNFQEGKNNGFKNKLFSLKPQ